MIEIIKKGHFLIRSIKSCGDGCCSWEEWESELCQVGETFYEDSIDLVDKVEDVDYIKINYR